MNNISQWIPFIKELCAAAILIFIAYKIYVISRIHEKMAQQQTQHAENMSREAQLVIQGRNLREAAVREETARSVKAALEREFKDRPVQEKLTREEWQSIVGWAIESMRPLHEDLSNRHAEATILLAFCLWFKKPTERGDLIGSIRNEKLRQSVVDEIRDITKFMQKQITPN